MARITLPFSAGAVTALQDKGTLVAAIANTAAAKFPSSTSLPRLFCGLVVRTVLRYFSGVKTLTVEEAAAGLGRWVERALAGEQIQIRKGDAAVELRPARPNRPAEAEALSPREALRLMQEESRLMPEQAEQYMREVRDERLAAEAWRPA